MADIVTTKPAGLPADMLSKIASGIAENRAATSVAGGGKPLLRLLRDGIWVYGQENIEVQDKSRWAVNPMQLSHGWVCWLDGGPNAKNEMAGEIMGPMWEPRVPKPAPVGNTPFKEQFGCELKCISGDDAGVEVQFKTPSDGGIRAMIKLRDEVQRHLANGGAAFPCPVLELTEESYNHSKWGKIYKPIMDIVGWCDMNGTMEGEAAPQLAAAAPEPDPVPEPPKAARARRAPAAAAEAAPAREEPLPTQQVHTGQRRRPAAR
jgi:hypothetical protein